MIINFKKISVVIIFITIFIIVISIIKLSTDTFDSEIEFKNNAKIYKGYDNIEIGCRKFDILPDDIKSQINEIFQCDYLCWKDNAFGNKIHVSKVNIFKGFESVYHKTVPKIISSNKLVYFPNNSIKIKDVQYFKCKDKCFFPTPNSIIYVDQPIEWVGDKNVNIVISTII
jgi:hypothetical protein